MANGPNIFQMLLVESCDYEFYRGRLVEYEYKNVERCTSAAVIFASDGSHIALSRHLLGCLFAVPTYFRSRTLPLSLLLVLTLTLDLDLDL